MTMMIKMLPIPTLLTHTKVSNIADGDNEKRITATNMVIDPTDCDEPCDAIVTVVWENIGKKQENFRPTIEINGAKVELGTEITLDENQTTIQTFNLTDLMEGIYTICPYPN